MIRGAISDSDGSTPTIPIEMVQFDLLQVRLAMNTVPKPLDGIIHFQT